MPSWARLGKPGVSVVKLTHIILCTDRCQPYRIKLSLRNGESTVSGDQWPLLVYKDYIYNPENPWAGVFHSSILVKASVCVNRVRRSSLTSAGDHQDI